MSELLKDVMNERAMKAEGPDLDLDAIVANGDKRVRRNRVLLMTVATAAAVLVAVAVPLVISAVKSGDNDPQPVDTPGEFEQRTTTYSVSSTIYYGDVAVDVSPHEVTTLVQTDYGFVFTADVDEGQGVFFTNGSAPERIGTTNQPSGKMLAGDDAGPYVAWVDTDAEPLPELVVYDTSTSKEVARTSEGNTKQPARADESRMPAVVGVDSSTAYWHRSDGVASYNIGEGTSELIQPNADATWLFDVAAGVLARSSFDDQSVTVSPDPAADGPTVPGHFAALLSADAAYVSTGLYDTARMYDVSTGDEITMLADGYAFTVPMQWIDGDAYTALGVRVGSSEDDPVDALTCSVGARSCLVDRESIGTYGSVQFPLGESLRAN